MSGLLEALEENKDCQGSLAGSLAQKLLPSLIAPPALGIP